MPFLRLPWPVLTAAVLFFVAAAPCTAADFTFTVPVQVSNLPPDSRNASVHCLVYRVGRLRPGASPAPDSSGAALMGTGTLAGGAFRGEVTVTVNANPGVDPATITDYSCGLSFVATQRGRDTQFAYWVTAVPSTLPLAPGAPFSPRVDGSIR